MLHVAESFRTRPRKTRLSSLLHTIHYSAKRQMPNKGEGAVIIFILKSATIIQYTIKGRFMSR